MSASAFAGRAASADAALMAYMSRTSCDCDDCLAELLRALMHWADVARLNVLANFRYARSNYGVEMTQDEVCFDEMFSQTRGLPIATKLTHG